MSEIRSAEYADAICLAGLLFHNIIWALALLIPQKQFSQGSLMAQKSLGKQGTSFRKDVAISALSRKHRKV